MTANLDAQRREGPDDQRREAIVRDAGSARPEDYLTAQQQLAEVKATKCKPFPAFGVLLTTYMYVETLPARIGVCRAIEIEILTPIELIKDDLLDPLRRAMLHHRDWFRTFKQHPLTDKKKTHQAAELLRRPKVTFPDERNEYLQEALREDHIAALREECQNNPGRREAHIRTHLKKAADRAIQRLKKQPDRDTAAPKGWRKEARARLDELI